MVSRQIIPPPHAIDIALTGRCNLRCEYCFYADEMVALTDLPTQVWLAFFQQLGQIGIMRTSLTGGEVFSRPDFFELVDGIIANRMRYSLLTNGTLITEKTIRQFDVGKRRLRLDSIQISIDGSTATIHNKNRPDSFDRAIRAVKLLKAAGFPLTVRVTVTKNNLDDLEQIAELLLEKIGLPSFSTNEAMPLGAGCHHQDQVTLSAKELEIAIAIFDQLSQRYPGRINSQAGPHAKLDSYAQMEHARCAGLAAEPRGRGYLTACGGIFQKLGVLHDGSIVPCHIMYATVLGNITNDSLLEIWRTHPVFLAMRSRRDIPLSEVEGCQDCEWNPYCNGSCPGLAQQLTGDFNRANPVDCYRRFLAEKSR